MTLMNGNTLLDCLSLAGRILASEAQQIEMTTRVFQQGAQDYEGYCFKCLFLRVG